ncbi:WXG100 family type VII secretion target [Streptomyces sp. SL13]|jgi:early secretory antigenic target protein ESAT-6|uniref:ESAT-6-like protein n=1 Tax=Streptantibioticus silvisoli TaxID=2705255 RepID=A0AA90KAV9_9ACTN|nr:WXG100 family type VII secretion target [Streptantibioticus silvisoli]MDI5965334.1 WXG100 family type VII secretion target [Streptantibioticus silvisoli]MDI5972883.1 WXG100 family type VII secretion target [Streptantibioticus silvisoli]
MTGTDGIHANHAGIHSHASDVLDVAKTIRNGLDELKHQVAHQAATWTGEAQTAYQALQSDWNRNADDLQNVLTKIATLMGTAADDYQSTDKKYASNFGQ